MSYERMAVYHSGTMPSLGRDTLMRGDRTRADRPEAPPLSPTGTVQVPVRGTSVVTGRERACRGELVGFASPIGRLSAVIRITDEGTGNIATSVVPVELRAPIEGAAEIAIPPSDVRARELRAETEAVLLAVRPPVATLLAELLTLDSDDRSVHRLALCLTTALRGGALATA
jgi:hypothetical protein